MKLVISQWSIRVNILLSQIIRFISTRSSVSFLNAILNEMVLNSIESISYLTDTDTPHKLVLTLTKHRDYLILLTATWNICKYNCYCCSQSNEPWRFDDRYLHLKTISLFQSEQMKWICLVIEGRIFRTPWVTIQKCSEYVFLQHVKANILLWEWFELLSSVTTVVKNFTNFIIWHVLRVSSALVNHRLIWSYSKYKMFDQF